MSDTADKNGGAEPLAFAEREAALTAEIERLKADAAERDRVANEAAAAARHAANVAFAEDQFKAGKLAPRGKGRVVVLLDQLDAETPISFGEADGDMTPAAAFKSLFADAQPIVSFGELAGADKGDPAVPTDPVAIAALAVSFADSEAKAGRTVTIPQAVRHVQAAAAT